MKKTETREKKRTINVEGSKNKKEYVGKARKTNMQNKQIQKK